MPTILDSLFHKVVNTASSPIRVEGGGWWGTTKWWDLPIQKLFMAKWLQFRLFSAPHVTKCSYIVLNLTSQYCSDSLIAVCLAGQVEAIYRPPRHPKIPDRPMNKGLSKSRPLTLWQWYKYELLVYCCICQLAVKSET